MKTLYPVQETHAKRLRKGLLKYRAAIDASQTGCGKTVCAAEISKRLGVPTLVVCPKSIIPVWERELNDRHVNTLDVLNYEKLRGGNTPFGKFVKSRWVWNLPEDTLIIWDECQRLQSPKSKNCKMAIEAAPYLNLMLSATAAEDPMDMRAIGSLLGLFNLSRYWDWCRLSGCKKNPWGGLEFKGGATNLARIHDQIFAVGKGSRLSTNDLADHFMETQIIREPLNFGDEGDIERLYNEMDREIEGLKTEMSDDSDNPAAKALVAQLRARQQVELLKVPLMVEMAESLMKEGRSVALFVNFDATLKAISTRLDTECVIHGKQTGEKGAMARERAINDFQTGISPVIICNIAAGGVGVSLHDTTGGHPRTALISPSFNAKELIQVLGRIHRAGGKTPSQQHILFAAGTIEERVAKSLDEKIRNMEVFNTGTLDTEPKIEQPEKHTTSTMPVDSSDQTDTAPHAEFGPSKLKYYEMCPSWRDRKDDDIKEVAEAGHRIHDALEKGNIECLADNERAVAEACITAMQKIVAAARSPVVSDHREIRFDIDLGGGISTFGTCDRLYVLQSNKAIGIDYKSGWLEVEDAETNPQAHAYVLGAFQKHPEITSIDFYFLAPNRQEISFAQFDRKDEPELQLRLNTIVRRAMEGGVFHPHPHLCEWCSNQANCAALHDKVLHIARRVGEDGLEVPDNVNVSKGLDGETGAKLLRLIPALSQWIDAVKKEMFRLHVEEGVDIPGYRLAERSTPRSVESVAGAWEIVQKRVSLEDFLSACGRVSMPQLESHFADSSPHGEKGKAKQHLENLMRDAGLLKEAGVIRYLKAERK